MTRARMHVFSLLLAGAIAAAASPVTAAATWARLSWTNPPQSIDSVRCRRARAPGDTIAVALYSATSPLTAKRVGLPGQADSGFVSVSIANVVGPASIRLFVETHNTAGWSGPSNPLSLFYAARDTFYLGPPLAAPTWSRGPGLLAYAQELGDSAWAGWSHAEVVQAVERSRLCLIYGYACRRGVRDTTWCSQP